MGNEISDLICHLKRTAEAFCIDSKLDGILSKKLSLGSFPLVIFHNKCTNALNKDQSWFFIIFSHKCIQCFFCLINVFNK